MPSVGVVVAAAIGEVVVEAGATYSSPGYHDIEARRRAWVESFSNAPWVHDPPVGYEVRPKACTLSGFFWSLRSHSIGSSGPSPS